MTLSFLCAFCQCDGKLLEDDCVYHKDCYTNFSTVNRRKDGSTVTTASKGLSASG